MSDFSEILVPTFEIASCPTIQISEIKARRFYIVDENQIKAKEAIQKEEDANIFAAINACLPNSISTVEEIIKPRKVINPIFELEI